MKYAANAPDTSNRRTTGPRWHRCGSAPPRWRRGIFAASTLLFLLVWPVVLPGRPRSGIVTIAPSALVALEGSVALLRFFAALVLMLLPDNNGRWHLYWLGGALIVLGSGAFSFGYLQPFMTTAEGSGSHNAVLYASLAVWTIAGIFLTVGLVPARAPRTPRWIIIGAAVALAGCCLLIAVHARSLPPLLADNNPTTGTVPEGGFGQGLPYYWVLASVPLSLAIVGATAAVYRRPGSLGGWIAVGLFLHAGAQWHNLFWPSAYGPMLTTTVLLRFCSALAVALGAVLELRRLATEHAALLTIEQEYSKRLGDMAVLKADFTSMVAHELGTPIAAIRALTEMLATGAIASADQPRIWAAIRAEADASTALVSDVRIAATTERDDFAVRRRPVAVAIVLADARAFASALPGEHPWTITAPFPERVMADPERIGQVLRNLLSNAAKYSAPGSPIEVRAIRTERAIRVQVVDRGFWHPALPSWR